MINRVLSEAPSEEASLSDVFLYVTSGDIFVQLTSALFCQIHKVMIGGFTPPPPPVQAIQFMGSVSQPIIAATEQLGVYAPLLRGLFI